MWLQGYYSVASAETGRLSLQISDQDGTIVTTLPVTVARGGDFFLLSSTFVVPQTSMEVCRTAILEVGSATIAEPQSNASGLWCLPHPEIANSLAGRRLSDFASPGGMLCGTGLEPTKMFSESADFYDAIYSFKDYAAEAAQVAARVRAAHPGARTILDVACGTGEHAQWLARDHGFEVDGLDLDAGLLRAAREKHPAGSFFHADMSDFALEKQYDVVLCLFSSIGYLVTLARTRRALECFRRHLHQDSVLFVEPWFPPGGLEAGRVFRVAGTHQGREVERVSRNEIDGRISRLHFNYRVETPDGVRQASEVHELGLLTVDEMAAAFEESRLRAEFNPVGLTGRGLWTARPA